MVKTRAGRESAGNPSGQYAGPVSELDREDFWITLEAFATSPRGLGLHPDVFWALSWREFAEHKRLWADERADYFNAHFNGDGVMWLADDFLGTGNREGRKAQAVISKTNADLANIQLQSTVKPGSTEGIPDWAKGEYRAK